MFNLQGKTITIVGGKRSGMALAKLILEHQGHPKLSEHGPRESLTEEFLSWAEQNKVALEFKGHTPEFIQNSDVIVLSPGVSINSTPVEWAREKNIPILGEIEFAFQFCNKPVIAVTGSNGKTTTVTLISEVIKKAGYNVVLCGNVGAPFSSFVGNLNNVDYVVAEVSSFQMESLLAIGSPFRRENNRNGFGGFKPFVAVVLNFSQNHLDRHKDLQEYFEAKIKIFQNQTKAEFAVLNEQDERLRKLAPTLDGNVAFFNQKKSPDPIVTNPNYLAVLKVAEILNIPREKALNVLKEFKGVEHRLELVRTLDGVNYINDSKATTAEAGGWALRNMDKPTIMICGGKDKGIDYSGLRDLAKQKLKKMIVIGEAKEKMKKTFSDVISVEEAVDMKDAVLKAQKLAREGNNVLLSPMCASFDMFKDYEHRGKVFKEIVNNLNSQSALQKV